MRRVSNEQRAEMLWALDVLAAWVRERPRGTGPEVWRAFVVVVVYG